MTVSVTAPLFQIDAFAAAPFAGNPAAVVPLPAWPADALLQAIAAENNLAETAFIVATGDAFELRWFTPIAEVKLCGHATLASAFALWHCLDYSGATVAFETRHSGRLTVTRDDGLIWLDLPRQPCDAAQAPAALIDAMGVAPDAVFAGPNWLLRYPAEADIRALAPDMRALGALPERCVIATAPADATDIDFVSRLFAPNFGIDEDAVTGSAHCMLAPYWAPILDKTDLLAQQISARGGELHCRLTGDRVQVGGRACLYLSGKIHLPEEPKP